MNKYPVYLDILVNILEINLLVYDVSVNSLISK